MGFHFFKKPAFKYALSGFVTAIVGYGIYSVGVPVAKELNSSFAVREFKEFGVVGTYRKHCFSFVDRFHNLAQLESDNDSLRAQLALLDQKKTLEEAGIAERELASMNEVLEKKVTEETGSPVAHLPQTIVYEVPNHLMPSELYPLALAYFRKQDFEKSVAIFDHLFKIPEDRRYETAENYLMSAISWYHLKNYKLSRNDVAEALKRSHEAEDVHRKALLWDAMVEKAEGHATVAQAKLYHFIGQYPHSEEGEWINGGRKPAEKEASDAKK
jgi:tetratricopeptide (TPR) repeat protein